MLTTGLWHIPDRGLTTVFYSDQFPNGLLLFNISAIDGALAPHHAAVPLCLAHNCCFSGFALQAAMTLQGDKRFIIN
jgi:hypothetical protein